MNVKTDMAVGTRPACRVRHQTGDELKTPASDECPSPPASASGSYHLFVPEGNDRQERHRLVVVVHGYRRDVTAAIEPFRHYAHEQRAVVLAPFFPESEHYQDLGLNGGQHRADLLLLDQVAEIRWRYGLKSGAFDLFGFSAGAQFVHRFLYLHPGWLRSVVVASPGTVTLPTLDESWPHGLAGLAQLSGISFDLEAVRRVRALLVVGDDDVRTGNLNHSDEANRFGQTRLERVRTLHRSWCRVGIPHEYVEVPGLGHKLDKRIGALARRFLVDG